MGFCFFFGPPLLPAPTPDPARTGSTGTGEANENSENSENNENSENSDTRRADSVCDFAVFWGHFPIRTTPARTGSTGSGEVNENSENNQNSENSDTKRAVSLCDFAVFGVIFPSERRQPGPGFVQKPGGGGGRGGCVTFWVPSRRATPDRSGREEGEGVSPSQCAFAGVRPETGGEGKVVSLSGYALDGVRPESGGGGKVVSLPGYAPDGVRPETGGGKGRLCHFLNTDSSEFTRGGETREDCVTFRHAISP